MRGDQTLQVTANVSQRGNYDDYFYYQGRIQGLEKGGGPR